MRPVIACLIGLLGIGPTAWPAGATENDVAARREMVRIVELQIATMGAEIGIDQLNPRVLDVMREVPRHAA